MFPATNPRAASKKLGDRVKEEREMVRGQSLAKCAGRLHTSLGVGSLGFWRRVEDGAKLRYSARELQEIASALSWKHGTLDRAKAQRLFNEFLEILGLVRAVG